MKATVHRYGGINATAYILDAGEAVARHRHPNSHTTGVITGRTEVEIWNDDGSTRMLFQMNPGDVDYVLPPDLDHEIRALENGTIALHMVLQSIGPSIKPSILTAAGWGRGGVLLVDGTVINDPA